MRNVSIALTLCAWFCGTPAPAAAQAPPAPEVSPEQKQRARGIYNEGEAFYNLGRYTDAAAKFEEAYILYPDPAMLFNLGRANERAGHLAKASFFYRRYLETYPNATDRADIERRVRDLEGKQQMAAQDQAVEAERQRRAEAQISERAQADKKLRTTGYIVGGAGLVLVGTSFVFGALARSRQNDLEDAFMDGDVTYDDVAGKQDEGKRFELVQIITLGAGAAAVIAGGVLVWLGWPEDSPTPTVSPTASGATFSLEGRF